MNNGTAVWLQGIKGFDRSRVWDIESKFALLYREKTGTEDSLWAIPNFERWKFNPSKVTCTLGQLRLIYIIIIEKE